MRGQNLRKATKDGVELILQLVKSTTEAIPIPRPQRTKKGNRKIQREPLGEDRSDRHPARRKPTKHTPLTLPVPSQPYPSLRPPHTSPPPPPPHLTDNSPFWSTSWGTKRGEE